MTGASAHSLLAGCCKRLLQSDPDARVLVFGDEGQALVDEVGSKGVRFDHVDALGQLDEATESERFTLAIVVAELPPDSEGLNLSQLLAALRDRYARRVLVWDKAETMVLADYLALGFERLADAGLSGLYLFDPDAESRQREWNNARDWANPENFDRFRW